jgi:hypothetical protein
LLRRIFAEETAHRRKVLPEGDRFCSIEIGVWLNPAIAAMEIRLIRTDTKMQTARTHLGSIARLNEDDLDTGLFCLVTDHRLQFCKAPIVNYLRFPAVSNPSQVFQNDPLIITNFTYLTFPPIRAMALN